MLSNKVTLVTCSKGTGTSPQCKWHQWQREGRWNLWSIFHSSLSHFSSPVSVRPLNSHLDMSASSWCNSGIFEHGYLGTLS